MGLPTRMPSRNCSVRTTLPGLPVSLIPLKSSPSSSWLPGLSHHWPRFFLDVTSSMPPLTLRLMTRQSSSLMILPHRTGLRHCPSCCGAQIPDLTSSTLGGSFCLCLCVRFSGGPLQHLGLHSSSPFLGGPSQACKSLCVPLWHLQPFTQDLANHNPSLAFKRPN